MCDVQDSKFVPFLLCFTKRIKTEDGLTSKLSLKRAIGSPEQTLDEAELRKEVKVLQYEAVISLDIREFKKGQVF